MAEFVEFMDHSTCSFFFNIVRSNLFLLGHIPFLAGQTSIIIILNL